LSGLLLSNHGTINNFIGKFLTLMTLKVTTVHESSIFV